MNQATAGKGGPVKSPLYIRRGAEIIKLSAPEWRDDEGNIVRAGTPKEETMYPSVNVAKMESRALQLETDGKLGLGTVKVVPYKKPKTLKKRFKRAAKPKQSQIELRKSKKQKDKSTQKSVEHSFTEEEGV